MRERAELTIGSLFSGIGGLELGLERAGLGPVVWQVEKDAYCRAVLAKHWPDATRYEDVNDVGGRNLAPVDVLCGGFPCQDISSSGEKVGIAGARSGLWFEYARIIRELRPRYVVVENVADLLARGMDAVLGELAECGYDAEWSLLSALDVGAPHVRDRLFIVAYPNADSGRFQERAKLDSESLDDSTDWDSRGQHADGLGFAVADAASPRCAEGLRASSGPIRNEAWRSQSQRRSTGAIPDTDGQQHESPSHAIGGERGAQLRHTWATEPDVGRVAHGVPARVDRLRALGNAVVPQVAEVVGRVILELERQRCEAA